jgi:hypothetical protein
VRRTSTEGSAIVCCRAIKTEIFFGLKSRKLLEIGFFPSTPKWWAPGSSAPILRMRERGPGDSLKLWVTGNLQLQYVRSEWALDRTVHPEKSLANSFGCCKLCCTVQYFL